MAGFKEFSFEHGDEHVGVKSKRLKLEQGNTYRLSFIHFPGIEKGQPDLDAEGPKFIGAPTHYLPGVGYVINKGPEYTKLAGEPPRSRIATIVVVWPTDKQGQLNKVRLLDGEFEVRAWVLGDDKYKTLKQHNKEFPFGHHDVTVTCTETQYQKASIGPCKDSVMRSLMTNPKGGQILERIWAEAQELAANLGNEVGIDMTIEQIRAKQAGGSASGGAGRASVGSPNTAVTGNVDGLLDNLLDN